MRDESQNALLKTLEEPPRFAHLILLSSEPEALLETVASRCQPIEFAALPTAAVEAALEGEPEEVAAAARARRRRRRAGPLPALGPREEAARCWRSPGRGLRPAGRLSTRPAPLGASC